MCKYLTKIRFQVAIKVTLLIYTPIDSLTHSLNHHATAGVHYCRQADTA
jgi:hypothetical protein